MATKFMEIISAGSDNRRLNAIEKLGIHLAACGKPAGDITSRLADFIDSDFVPRFGSNPGIGLLSNFDRYFVRVGLEVPTFFDLEQQTLEESQRLNDLSEAFTSKVAIPCIPQQVRFHLTFTPIGEVAKTSFEGMCQIVAYEQGSMFHGIYPDPNIPRNH